MAEPDTCVGGCRGLQQDALKAPLPAGVQAPLASDAQAPLAGALELEGMLLLPGRALFRPAYAQLVVADVHLGKAASFRAKGVPVPEAATLDNFGRLDTLVRLTAARQLVILGDLTHDAVGRRNAREPWLTWRTRHPALEVVLVPGNHDLEGRAAAPVRTRCAGTGLQAPALPEERAWPGMRVVASCWVSHGLVMVHEADRVAPDTPLRQGQPKGDCAARKTGASRCDPEVPEEAVAPRIRVLCGHLHPVVRIPTLAGRHTLRRPCFFLDASGCLHLPAFGSFTGGHPVDPRPGERVFVDTVDQVRALPEGFARGPGLRSRMQGHR